MRGNQIWLSFLLNDHQKQKPWEELVLLESLFFKKPLIPVLRNFFLFFFGQTFFRSRFAPSSLNFKTRNSSFGTIFQNQGFLAPIQKQCLFLGTHYTLSNTRNCISIEFYNKQTLRFRKVLISFVTN